MLNLFKFKIESDFLQNALWILQDALQFSINGGTKTNGLILNIVQAFCSGARVRYRRFEAGFGHPKLEQRPPAATDPSTRMDTPAAAAAVGAIFDHAYCGLDRER